MCVPHELDRYRGVSLAAQGSVHHERALDRRPVLAEELYSTVTLERHANDGTSPELVDDGTQPELSDDSTGQPSVNCLASINCADHNESQHCRTSCESVDAEVQVVCQDNAFRKDEDIKVTSL